MAADQFNPVIFDLGASTVRAGWAGHDNPKIIESSYIGTKSDASIDPLPVRFLNNKRSISDSMEITRVQEYDEESTEWIVRPDRLQSIADTVMYSARGLETNPLERPLFATRPSGALSKDFKKSYFEHFLETVQVPAFFLGDSSVLSLYAVGRISGLCVDSGASGTTVASVKRGVVVDSNTYSFAGDYIDQFILNRVDGLSTLAPPLDSYSESYAYQYRLSLAREIKHSICKCSHHPLPPQVSSTTARSTRSTRKNMPMSSPSGRHQADTQPVSYKLPDGSEVDVGGVQEYAAEQLLLPSGDFPGLVDAITPQLEEDKFVLLTGNGAHFHGLHTRIVNELPPDVNVFPFAQWTHRNHSAFVGASILASLSSFSNLWVTPASYRENGIDRL
jgi:actin-related protein